MPAYVFGDVDVTDPTGYEEYKRRVAATIAAYGGRYLTRAGAMELLEGEWTLHRVVILEFPDMARLKAWYDSPEYRPLREIRQRCAKTTLLVLEGVTRPGPDLSM